MKFIRSLLKPIASVAGFTMIELLIVIAILGILAVAVLSAINPVEQINRGRDTGTRSDAEQLLSAIDRFNAFQGYVPWVRNANDAILLTFQSVEDSTWVDNGTNGDCEVLAKLADGDTTATDTCSGSQELKSSFNARISASGYNELYIYNSGQTGASTYICFQPQSGAFLQEAQTRCDGTMPGDLLISAGICGDGSLTNADGDAISEPMICLP